MLLWGFSHSDPPKHPPPPTPPPPPFFHYWNMSGFIYMWLLLSLIKCIIMVFIHSWHAKRGEHSLLWFALYLQEPSQQLSLWSIQSSYLKNCTLGHRYFLYKCSCWKIMSFVFSHGFPQTWFLLSLIFLKDISNVFSPANYSSVYVINCDTLVIIVWINYDFDVYVWTFIFLFFLMCVGASELLRVIQHMHGGLINYTHEHAHAHSCPFSHHSHAHARTHT